MTKFKNESGRSELSKENKIILPPKKMMKSVRLK